MLEFVKEPLDEVAFSIEPFAESRWFEPVGHGLHVRLGTACRESFTQSIGIIGSIGK